MNDQEFRQRVRRHKPSSLVPLLAREAAQYWSFDRAMTSPHHKYMPWTLLEIARVSLVYGNEYRGLANSEDLLACCNAFDSLPDPELGDRSNPATFANWFLRAQNQQLPYQHPVQPELARSAALFMYTKPKTDLKTLTDTWLIELLGANLSDHVGVTFLLFASALNNGGVFGPKWLEQPNFDEVTRVISSDTIQDLLKNHFVANAKQLRAMQCALPSLGSPGLRRFRFNPLVARPVVRDLLPNLHVVPVPLVLLRKASPLGIFYAGVEKWGQSFCDDIGPLFEAYVGRQLQLLPGAMILPEIIYSKPERRSVDWFVILENLVLLVEVKSTRPSEQVRIGGPSAGEALRKALNKAVCQVDTTVECIAKREPAFTDIPNDRPLAALMITMEPFFAANTPFLSTWVQRPTVPSRFCSASELEGLVTVDIDNLSGSLLEHLTGKDTNGWTIHSFLEGRSTRPNPILDEGWAAYPWCAATSDVELGRRERGR